MLFTASVSAQQPNEPAPIEDRGGGLAQVEPGRKPISRVQGSPLPIWCWASSNLVCQPDGSSSRREADMIDRDIGVAIERKANRFGVDIRNPTLLIAPW
jgi:hypothetical protein